MLKVVLGTLAGFGLTIIGFVIGYFFLLGVENAGSPLLLIPSMVLIGAGIYVLVRASRLDMSKPKFNSPELKKSGQVVLDKNNKIIAEWNKTNDARDKLKMVEASVVANNE